MGQPLENQPGFSRDDQDVMGYSRHTMSKSYHFAQHFRTRLRDNKQALQTDHIFLFCLVGSLDWM
jgi:hypothetical protein